MDKTYTFITFGQVHAHCIGGKTFDKDCIAAIPSKSEREGREIAREAFNNLFHQSAFGTEPPKDWMPYFPRGVIVL